MELFRIPRREVAVRIVLDDGRSLDGRLFTAPAGHDGVPESVQEHLNDPSEDFVPLACAEDRFLLNKAGIILVQLPEGTDRVDGLDEGIGRDVAVRLTLAGGTSLIGRVRIAMPPERSRVLDYLNAAPRFLPLLGEGVVTLVNRNYIVSARGSDAS